MLDAMGDDWWDEETLARRCSIRPRGVEALCRFAIALGLMRRAADGRVQRTDLGRRYLVAGSNDDIGPIATISADVWDSFTSFTSAVVSGPRLETAGYFGELGPAELAGFFATMDRTARSKAEVFHPDEVANAYTLLDVGSGPATVTRELLRANPRLRATLIDAPAVLEMTAQLLAQEGLEARCTLLPGSFFEVEFPRGTDIVLLGRILHDWPDRECNLLLAKAVAALNEGGRIGVVEEIIHDPADPELWASLLDLFLFCRMGDGRTRSVAQIGVLLDGVNCTITRAERLDALMSVIVARKKGAG